MCCIPEIALRIASLKCLGSEELQSSPEKAGQPQPCLLQTHLARGAGQWVAAFCIAQDQILYVDPGGKKTLSDN